MRFIFEMDAGRFQLSEAFHKAFLVGVDQDVVDGRILEQGLDRPEARLAPELEHLEFAALVLDAELAPRTGELFALAGA